MVSVILSYQVGRQWKVGTIYLDFVGGGGIKGGKPDKIFPFFFFLKSKRKRENQTRILGDIYSHGFQIDKFSTSPIYCHILLC